MPPGLLCPFGLAPDGLRQTGPVPCGLRFRVDHHPLLLHLRVHARKPLVPVTRLRGRLHPVRVDLTLQMAKQRGRAGYARDPNRVLRQRGQVFGRIQRAVGHQHPRRVVGLLHLPDHRVDNARIRAPVAAVAIQHLQPAGNRRALRTHQCQHHLPQVAPPVSTVAVGDAYRPDGLVARLVSVAIDGKTGRVQMVDIDVEPELLQGMGRDLGKQLRHTVFVQRVQRTPQRIVVQVRCRDVRPQQHVHRLVRKKVGRQVQRLCPKTQSVQNHRFHPFPHAHLPSPRRNQPVDDPHQVDHVTYPGDNPQMVQVFYTQLLNAHRGPPAMRDSPWQDTSKIPKIRSQLRNVSRIEL